MDFVKDLETSIGRKLECVDIGGGLSTTYKDSEEPDGFAYQRYLLGKCYPPNTWNNFFKRYRSLLEEKTPELFSGKYRVITEFGRSLLLKAGKSLTRINYIKDWLPDFVKPICLTHLGTNQFVRAVYLPQVWGHRLSALDGTTGESKTGVETVTYDIAGPLCFQVGLIVTILLTLGLGLIFLSSL